MLVGPSAQETGTEDWVDREIAYLRELIDSESQAQAPRAGGALARLREWIEAGTAGLPPGFGGMLRPVRPFVRTRSFDVTLYGLAIATAAIVGWLVGR